MPKTVDAWGIEVGANALKAVHLVSNGEEIDVADYEVMPFKQILATPDIDVDEEVRVKLDEFLSRHTITKSTVLISVPGHMAFARFAKLPPVDPKKVNDIVTFEATQQIPFPMEQVEWDYQIFMQEDSPDVEVGIFAITKDRVGQFLANYRAVGLTPDGLTLSPLAVYNAVAHEMDLGEDSPGVIIMDIGTTSTDVIIVESGAVWLRTLPIGGNNFTEALVRAFKLSFPKAEKLKREAGTSKYAKQLFQAMRPVFADLVQELQRSLGYYQSLNRESNLTQIVGLGSTFRLPGLQKFLKQQLDIDVIRPDTFKKVQIEGHRSADFASHSIELGTAYGLALQGLELERVSANILPRQIIKQRLWRKKQWWIGVAALLMFGATVLAGARLFIDKNLYSSGKTQTAAHINKILERGTKLKDELNNVQGSDPRQRIENLRRILDYRDLWSKVLQDVSMVAASLEPQSATVEADWGNTAGVVRRERKRVYIQSIEVDYVFEGDFSKDVQWDKAAALPAMGSLSFGRRYIGGPDASARRGREREDEKKKQEDVKPPRFKVHMTGTTPYHDAPRMLKQVIVWLRERAERADRPYRILATGDSVASLIPVKSLKSAEENRSKGTEPGRFGARGAGGARSRRGGGFGGLPDAGFAGSATVNRGRRARYLVPDAAEQSDEEVEEVIELSLESLFPERPGIDEDDSGDWQFELEWEVELIPPNEARKKADADKAGKTADAGEPAAADASRADTALTRTTAENRS